MERGVVEEIVTNTRAGTVKVRQRASLSPQMGGLVTELPHREGSWVSAGDLLLKLDDCVRSSPRGFGRHCRSGKPGIWSPKKASSLSRTLIDGCP